MTGIVALAVLTASGGGPLPPGFTYLITDDGKYVTTDDGKYIVLG